MSAGAPRRAALTTGPAGARTPGVAAVAAVEVGGYALGAVTAAAGGAANATDAAVPTVTVSARSA